MIYWKSVVVILCILIFEQHAADPTTTTPKPEVAVTNATIPATNQTDPQTTTTTVHPTVNTLQSKLCQQKCNCLKDTLTLDCSYRNLTKWFDQDELDTLIYGDIKFEKILLNGNQLDTVPVFPKLPIKQLLLEGNKIIKIEPNAFRELEYLEDLDLSANQLTSATLTPAVFAGKYSPTEYEPLKNLKKLNLASNLLHSLNADLFEHFPNLENLTLASNTFKVIDTSTENAIASLMNLKYLDMSYMGLSLLPNYIYHTPQNIEFLILTGNLFRTLPEAIGYASNLKYLRLDENLFTEFDGTNIFPNLFKLEELHLCYNSELVKIGNQALSKLHNLKKLHITNNPKLIQLHSNALCRQRENEINFDFPPIEDLHLHNNNLSILSGSLLDRWDHVKHIDLRQNPWQCDCDNDFMINVLFTQILKDTPELTKNVNCSSPEPWKNLPVQKIHDKKSTLRCKDIYNNHPENDGSVLVGMLIGLLIGIPLAFVMLVLYRRGCFGLIGQREPIHYSRAFYSKAQQVDYQL